MASVAAALVSLAQEGLQAVVVAPVDIERSFRINIFY